MSHSLDRTSTLACSPALQKILNSDLDHNILEVTEDRSGNFHVTTISFLGRLWRIITSWVLLKDSFVDCHLTTIAARIGKIVEKDLCAIKGWQESERNLCQRVVQQLEKLEKKIKKSKNKEALTLLLNNLKSHIPPSSLKSVGAGATSDSDWDSYVNKHVRVEKGMLLEWRQLPSEALIQEHTKNKTTDEIFNTVNAELLRDCAIAYKGFRESCLKNSQLWQCFTAYPEYLVDISQKDAQFAREILTSSLAATLLGDDFRLELFDIAYPLIIQAIEEGSMNSRNLVYLSAYLIRYKRIIGDTEFAKIQDLAALITAHPALGEHRQKMVDYLINKLTLQKMGVEPDPVAEIIDQEMVSVFSPARTGSLVDKLVHKLQSLTDVKDRQKSILFLLCVPKDHPNFWTVHSALGFFFEEAGEFKKAGQSFWKAAVSLKNKEEEWLQKASKTDVAKDKAFYQRIARNTSACKKTCLELATSCLITKAVDPVQTGEGYFLRETSPLSATFRHLNEEEIAYWIDPEERLASFAHLSFDLDT